MRALVSTVAVVFALQASGCTECEALLDCPAGFLCTPEGRCRDECPDGDVEVSIIMTAPDRVTPVAGAISVDGAPLIDTGGDATVTLTLPAGEHGVFAQRGSFYGNETIEVCGPGPATVQVPVRPPPGTLGVVPGAFDTIDVVLLTMGFRNVTDFEIIDENVLASAEEMGRFNYIFFNCGHVVPLTPAIAANLDDWVRGGGSLYTSDWAFDVIGTVWPEVGTGVRDGVAGLYEADVLDPVLIEHLGKSDVTLDYNLGIWSRLTSVAPSANVMVRGDGGDVDGMPLLIQFTRGAGRVTYTTFHNEAQTTADMDRILSFLVFAL